MRWRASASLLTCLVVTVPVVPLSADPGCAGRDRLLRGITGTWTTFVAPAFDEGPDELTAHAVTATRWWVTNGVAVARSGDGGCSWQQVLVLPEAPSRELPVSRATDRITRLAAHGVRLVLAVDVAAAAPTRGLIVNGDDTKSGSTGTVLLAGEDRFAALAPLASAVGAPGPVTVAPSDPDAIYAVAGGIVNASSDGGRSWRIASPDHEPVRTSGGGFSYSSDDTFPGVSRLAVDPRDPASLWVRERGRVHASADSGASWEIALTAEPTGTLPLLAVARPSPGPPRVTVGEQEASGTPLRSLRISDGKGFQVRAATASDLGAVEGSGQSISAGPARDDLVLTTTANGRRHGTYTYVPAIDQLVPVDEFALGPLLDVQRSGSEYAFRTGGRLVRWGPDLRPAAVPRPPAPPALEEFATAGPGRLGPLSEATRVGAPAEVSIPSGQSRTTALTLDVAPEPTPIDVFFLLDTSGSMNDVIDGLAAGFASLAQELEDRGYDARYGLGDYQDTGGMRYRRLVDLSPADGPLTDALADITTNGGAEPAYTALHQIATGSGVLSPSRGQPVPRGQGTSWRAGSLRVVVHATDEVPSEDPDAADRDTAVEAMRVDETRHVGIEVVRDAARQVTDSELVPPGELYDILSELARDTEALAPPGGVDCEGDGEIDIPGGEPLVCELTPGTGRVELAGPLERVLSALVDVQPVGIDVRPAAAVAQLQATTALTLGAPRVNVKRAHVQQYALTATCPVSTERVRRDLELRPRVGSRTGRVTTMTVVCVPGALAPPGPGMLVSAPLPPAAGVLLPALPPVPPPPAPVGAPAPAAAPAALPAAVPAPLPGVVVAVAPAQEEVELVLATQDSEFAMVDRRSRPDLLAMRMVALALVCAAATAASTRRVPGVTYARTRQRNR